MPKLNAVDAITPAFQLTKVNLFQPFRWSLWWRVALLGLLTGEMNSGGCRFNVPTNWRNGRGEDQFLSTAAPLPHIDPHLLWVVIPIFVVSAIILAVVFTYIASVFRFILVEATLNGKISIRDAWGRWKEQGFRYFGFQLLLMVVTLAIVGVFALLFIGLVGIGTLKQGGPAMVGTLLGAIILIGLLMFLALVPVMIVAVLAKDFAVPIMAMEGTTFRSAWRRVWGMASTEVGSVAGYFGMKIVLTIAAGIIFGILTFIVILMAAVPIGGLGLFAFLAGKGAGLTWNPFTITMVVVASTLLLALLMALIALVCAPMSMFFPAYGLYFLAGRYQPLHDRLFPPAPPAAGPPPAPETPPMPPDMPPEPITS